MEDKACNFVARPFQAELVELAVKQNVIVFLPTGAGKTFIAVMLIKKLSGDLRRDNDDDRKHTVFLANTIQLVSQQCEYIARMTDLSCCALTGTIGVDNWKKSDWNSLLNKYQVLVMTTQILVNSLCQGYMYLNRINLIIFDECHSAVNDHPMRQVMKLFQHYPKEKQPRVLGLSATLLNANAACSNIASNIQSLEVTFHAKVITSASAVQCYTQIITDKLIEYDEYILPNVMQQVVNIITEVTKILNCIHLTENPAYLKSSPEFRPKSKIRRIISLVNEIENQARSTGMYGANKCALLILLEMECFKKRETDLVTLCVIEYVITKVIQCRKLMEMELEGSEKVKEVYRYSCDQFLQCVKSIKEYYNNYSNKETFACIIFAKRRATVRTLFYLLKDLSTYNKEYEFLKLDVILGSSTQTFGKIREGVCLSKWNKESMHKFKKGLINCLIGTNVIDEGIDVPECDLIIRYDFPSDLRTYIQAKGRARGKYSTHIICIPRRQLRCMQQLKQFQTSHAYIEQFIGSKTTERLIPEDVTIEKELYESEIVPYTISSADGQSNYLTAEIAIPVLNQYCNALYKSKFSLLAPSWVLHKLQDEKTCEKFYKVSLQLPKESPFQEIVIGDAMKMISKAKRSAAMKACIELHKMGELTDKLIPNSVDMDAKNFKHLIPNWIEDNESENVTLIGTYKNKKQHRLHYPTFLYAAYPTMERTFIHLLCTKLKYLPSPNNNRDFAFYELLNKNAGFCILSSKPMPKIPVFPIFMSVGELQVEVKVNYGNLYLTASQILCVKRFHTLIFNKIVPVIKPFMVHDLDNRDNSFLIAAVDENFNVDWAMMEQYQSIERILPSTPFLFKENDYKTGLVKPNYRASADVYIITQICEDITPSSCFPTDNFYTYLHYYKEKHGLTIKELKQPMLEVKMISRNINYILPRSNRNAVKSRKDVDFQEHFVPELCYVIDFPALYWLKATMLPSILHRIVQLLLAEDLWCTIGTALQFSNMSSNYRHFTPINIMRETIQTIESLEPILDISVTENHEDTLQPELSVHEPEIEDTNLWQYPWTKEEEPPDIYKNISETQLIQVEHYCQFMYFHESSDHAMVKTEVCYVDVPSVQAPNLKIITVQNRKGPTLEIIMHALTTKVGQDAFSLERLEVLGDSYLKFAISLFLYNTYPLYTEGTLTMLKGKIVGNRNLYCCGVQNNIPGYMKVDDFVPLSNFIPPAYTVYRDLQAILLEAQVSPNVLYEIQIPEKEQFDGCISAAVKSSIQEKVLNWETAESPTGMEHYLGVQTVADKSVADCVEALIGAYVNSIGIKDTAKLLKWFGILPLNTKDVENVFYKKESRPVIDDKTLKNHMPWASDVEKRIGYKFNDRSLLLQAFTHPSCTSNDITNSYQKLEFIGDAILDFLITSYIYEHCGNLSPGTITDLRSALVNNITLACFTVRHGLHTALLSCAPILSKSMEHFVRIQEARNYEVNDEVLWILMAEDECNMAEYVDVPKVLGDIYESLIGSIYLDSNGNLQLVWEMIYRFMHKEIEQFKNNIPKQPIRVLYEMQDAKPQFLKARYIEELTTFLVPLRVTVAGDVKLFNGFGSTIKAAKCGAAKQALKCLYRKSY